MTPHLHLSTNIPMTMMKRKKNTHTTTTTKRMSEKEPESFGKTRIYMHRVYQFEYRLHICIPI